MIRPLLLPALFLLASGCTTLPESLPRHNALFAPATPSYRPPPVQPTGAIYRANRHLALFENLTAHQVGDILTIRLVENTDATKEAELEIKKGNKIGGSLPMLFGTAKPLGINFETDAKSTKNYKGTGKTKQNDKLTGTVTVTVVEVLPNGNLRVQGEKRITINDGHEYVRLSGIVRPVDLDADNSVPSTKVADATIMYTGEGAMADVKQVGWLTRFFNSVFFPF